MSVSRSAVQGAVRWRAMDTTRAARADAALTELRQVLADVAAMNGSPAKTEAIRELAEAIQALRPSFRRTQNCLAPVERAGKLAHFAAAGKVMTV